MQICAVLTLCLNEKKSVVKVNVCSTNTWVYGPVLAQQLMGSYQCFIHFESRLCRHWLLPTPPPHPIISYCLIVIVLLAHIDVSFTLANENNVFAAFSWLDCFLQSLCIWWFYKLNYFTNIMVLHSNMVLQSQSFRVYLICSKCRVKLLSTKSVERNVM